MKIMLIVALFISTYAYTSEQPKIKKVKEEAAAAQAQEAQFTRQVLPILPPSNRIPLTQAQVDEINNIDLVLCSNGQGTFLARELKQLDLSSNGLTKFLEALSDLPNLWACRLPTTTLLRSPSH